MLQITALMDNGSSSRKDLTAEHGLSLLLQYRGRRILLDCGPGENTLRNARKLGADLEKLDAVVLSHGHYDHAGGYRDLVERGLGGAPLYTGPGFFEKKYARAGLAYTDLSPGFGREFLDRKGIGHREVAGHVELFPGLHLLGDFPRVHDFETIPARFLRREGKGFVPDDFRDEICIAAEAAGGLVLLVGCAHPGILNMVGHARRVLGKPVKAVFGGTHLMEAEEGRIGRTIDGLRDLGVELLGLSHCSGEGAETAISRREDVRGCRLGVGDCFFLEDAPEEPELPAMGTEQRTDPRDPANNPRAHVFAHAHSGNHRQKLERDRVCGCFSCLRIFGPGEIREWIVSDKGDAQGTAICPHCGVDAVIGESSGYPITEGFLKRMKDFWFANEEAE